MQIIEDNYYKILGVCENASLEEIKNSYRKKALLYHPDKNINKNNKIYYEKKFKELSEAYQILSNSDTRKKYDENNMKWTTNDENEFENPFELFEKFFDNIPCEYIYFTTKIINKITKIENSFVSNLIDEIPNENKLKNSIKHINKIIETKYELYNKNKKETKKQKEKEPRTEKEPETEKEPTAEKETEKELRTENEKEKEPEIKIKDKINNFNNNKDELNIKTTIYISLEEVFNKEIKKIDITRLIINDNDNDKDKDRDNYNDNYNDNYKEINNNKIIKFNKNINRVKDKKTFIFDVSEREIIYYNQGDQYYDYEKNELICGDIIINIEYKEFNNYKIINTYDILYEKSLSLFEYIYGVEFEIKDLNEEIVKIIRKENILLNQDENKLDLFIGKGLKKNSCNHEYGNLYIKYKLKIDDLINNEIKEGLKFLFLRKEITNEKKLLDN